MRVSYSSCFDSNVFERCASRPSERSCSSFKLSSSLSSVDTRASASAVSGADGLTPLAYRRPLNRRLETVLRHRRFIIGTYLAFLHLLAYEYLFA